MRSDRALTTITKPTYNVNARLWRHSAEDEIDDDETEDENGAENSVELSPELLLKLNDAARMSKSQEILWSPPTTTGLSNSKPIASIEDGKLKLTDEMDSFKWWQIHGASEGTPNAHKKRRSSFGDTYPSYEDQKPLRDSPLRDSDDTVRYRRFQQQQGGSASPTQLPLINHPVVEAEDCDSITRRTAARVAVAIITVTSDDSPNSSLTPRTPRGRQKLESLGRAAGTDLPATTPPSPAVGTLQTTETKPQPDPQILTSRTAPSPSPPSTDRSSSFPIRRHFIKSASALRGNTKDENISQEPAALTDPKAVRMTKSTRSFFSKILEPLASF